MFKTIKNHKIEIATIILGIIGIIGAVFKDDIMNFAFWMAYFVFCLSNFGWNIHDDKLKDLQNRVEKLENK